MNDGQPKKTNKGCIIALAVCAVLVFLCAGGGLLFFSKLSNDPGFQKFTKAVGSGIELAQKGQTAPGTKEIRELGCQQAMVLSADDFKTFIGQFEKDSSKLTQFNFSLVQCQMGFGKAVVTCPQVVEAYMTAVPTPTEPFLVQVTKPGNKEPLCQKVYDTKGQEMEEATSGLEVPSSPSP